ncbi:MAG: response regulator [Candidatus Contendobacter sp.]|nr:response regulator [Candidatus Contendobacter sp.]MDS4060368.1 response regulator [Candidatus Contendobacter sp.]
MPIRHVLVVDDSKSARLMLRKILQNLGMTVDTADSAEEALTYLRDRKPDVIFMDHTMPGMDGLTALRRIRSEPTTARIPAAMYTSKDEPSYRNQAHAAGAVDVLSKPATPEALSALLERMNTLLDAATHPVVASTLASEGTMTAESIEKLILEKAEQFFYNAVESQVLPLVNDVVAKLRLDLEASQEETSNQVAAQVVEKRLANWQAPAVDTESTIGTALQTQLPPLVEEQFKTFQREGRPEIEQLIQEIATRVCQDQLHAFTDQLVPQLSARFSEATRKGSTAAQEAAVGAARETALATAREVALQAVTDAVTETRAVARTEESPTVVATRITRNLVAEAQRELRRYIYLAAGGAAAAGIGAALLVYGLR